ncbi:chromate transporter [Acidocella aminolytica 101 = DSM 11237]|uniref:Chromate transporter n=2 Tax=Acidocella TaxID=50709 RepID=A0A0D6PIA4_9PROT|nr:chromate transporter [Acidocella aminolytica 101 = DSM 11237]GBQ40847.1 chromate transport protein ChrA [Acidocella aminolytica 101 = DSM 11237]SHF32490.1 chromate transporter [Acidocella aminolytica 101 = DSM 11237]
MGFGGVLPIIRRVMVDDRRWLTQTEFNELFSLCQSLPGANVVNLSFAFGAREGGASGAVAAVTGLLSAPVSIVLVLAGLYARFGGLAPVRHALLGLAATAAGLALGSALRIASPILTVPRNMLLAAAVYGLAFGLHISLPLIVLGMLPLSLALSWRLVP